MDHLRRVCIIIGFCVAIESFSTLVSMTGQSDNNIFLDHHGNLSYESLASDNLPFLYFHLTKDGVFVCDHNKSFVHLDPSPPSYLPGEFARRCHKFIALASHRNAKHVLALDINGTVWGWGENRLGQLVGAKAPNSIKSPIQIENLKDIEALAVGDDFSLALDRDGKLWFWGIPPGFVPLGKLEMVFVPNAIKLSRSKLLSKKTRFKKIAAAHLDFIALDDSGNVWQWEQLALQGYKDRLSHAKKIKGVPPIIDIAMNAHSSFFLDEDGDIWELINWSMCGNEKGGPLQPHCIADFKAHRIFAGGRTALAALTEDGVPAVHGKNGWTLLPQYAQCEDIYFLRDSIYFKVNGLLYQYREAGQSYWSSRPASHRRSLVDGYYKAQE